VARTIEEKIEPGMRFGKLTVISEAEPNRAGGKQWHCKCDCGNGLIADDKALRNHRLGSCGCTGRTDLVGQRFGKYTVIGRATKSPTGAPRWLCKCDCGNERIVQTEWLTTTKYIPSCGCISHWQFVERNTTHGLSDTYLMACGLP